MPATPDDRAAAGARPVDPVDPVNPVDPEDVLAAAEDAHLAARREPGAGSRPAPRQRERPAAPVPPHLQPQPAPRPRRLGSRRAGHLAAASTVAAGWAAVQGFLPVLLVMALVQLAEGRTGSLAGLGRLGLAGWLLGHGVPLRTAAGPLGIAPLALSAFAAWRVARAGVQVTRAVRARRTGSAGTALLVSVPVGLVYAMLGALAAVVLDGPGIGVSAARAALNLGVFGLVASAAGALAATGAFEVLVGRTPAAVRDGVRTGLVAALIVLGAGAGLAGLALALSGGGVADTIAAYRAGIGGQAGITLLCLAFAPNAATWAAAYLVGPGFAVGLQTTVRTSEVSLGALPAVPLFAGLPHGSLGGAGVALLAVPLVAGMVAGGLLAGRSGAVARVAGRSGAVARVAGRSGAVARVATRSGAAGGWPGLLGAAVLGGPVAGLVLGLAGAVSSGPLGGGRLSQVGPAAVQVGLVGAAVIGAGALLGAAAIRLTTRHP
jgi:Family of unknown function (DUF6350)